MHEVMKRYEELLLENSRLRSEIAVLESKLTKQETCEGCLMLGTHDCGAFWACKHPRSYNAVVVPSKDYCSRRVPGKEAENA